MNSFQNYSFQNQNIFPTFNSNPINNAFSPSFLRFTRSPDGTQNLQNPSFGRMKNFMSRLSFPAYADGIEKPIDRGNPRLISNIMGTM